MGAAGLFEAVDAEIWRTIMRKIIVPAVAIAALAGAAHAAEVGGVKLDDKASVGGKELVLNGAGVRTRAVFKL